MKQRGGLAEAVLLVEQQIVEAAVGEELDDRRAAEDGPAAERALARAQAGFQGVRAKHGAESSARNAALEFVAALLFGGLGRGRGVGVFLVYALGHLRLYRPVLGFRL